MTPQKEELVVAILELELEMFLSVRTEGPNSCQENPEAFRIHRGAQFSVWSEQTLESYLADLTQAKRDGLNLMTMKYARMQGVMPPQNKKFLIENIVTIGLVWQREMTEVFPKFMSRARGLTSSDHTNDDTSFENYLRSECETYSDRTLRLLDRDYAEMRDEGVNGSRKVYDVLVSKMGYDSIAQVENAMG